MNAHVVLLKDLLFAFAQNEYIVNKEEQGHIFVAICSSRTTGMQTDLSQLQKLVS